MNTDTKTVDTAVAQFAFIVKEHGTVDEAWELVTSNFKIDPSDFEAVRAKCIEAGEKEIAARNDPHPGYGQ